MENGIMEAIRGEINDSILTKEKCLATLPVKIGKFSELIETVYRNKGKTLWCGNGGSAADAQHLAAELVARFKLERPGLPALALHANTSTITAWGNDYSYDTVYSRQVEAFGLPGDLLIGITTSGTSKNIVAAFEQAHKMGLITVALTGARGSVLAGKVDLLIDVPATDTPRIQEAHIMIGHIVCGLVEKSLFGEK